MNFFCEEVDEILKELYKVCKIAMANDFIGEVKFPNFRDDCEPLAEFSIALSDDCTEEEARKLSFLLYPIIYQWVSENDSIPIFLIGVRNTGEKRLSFRFPETYVQLNNLPENLGWFFDE